MNFFLKKHFIYVLLSIIIIYSCKKDEEVEPPRDLAEQAILDEQILEDFLSTHFYNYEDFQDPDNQTKIKFDTIANENSSKTPLIEQVNKSTINVRISDGSFINHPIYTLVARQGIGESPSSVDSTYLSYEGLLLNKSIFDKSITPIWFDLTSVVRGFREGMPTLKARRFFNRSK
jgi:FKBP-type peptidyl-prolyl cis-trans isomerase